MDWSRLWDSYTCYTLGRTLGQRHGPSLLLQSPWASVLLRNWRVAEGTSGYGAPGCMDRYTLCRRIEKKSLSSGETSENRLYNVPRIPRNPEMASLKWKTRILITYLWFPAIRFFWKCGQNLSRDLWKSSYSGDFDEAIIFVVSRRAELPVSDRVK